jgi:hypothetical protein
MYIFLAPHVHNFIIIYCSKRLIENKKEYFLKSFENFVLIKENASLIFEEEEFLSYLVVCNLCNVN